MSLLYNFKDSAKIEEIMMPWPSDEYTIPAGTPMSLTGIATGSDAVGILASDKHFPFTHPKSLRPETPKGMKECKFEVITGGVVNVKAIKTEIPDAVKNALNITFVDADNPSFGASLPFGEKTVMGDTLTWDGDITGKTTTIGSDGLEFAKVSDMVPEITDFKEGYSYGYDTSYYAYNYPECLWHTEDVINCDHMIYIALKDDVIYEFTFEDGSTWTIRFPEKGVYFCNGTEYERYYSVYRLTINGYNGFPRTEITPLPNKYLDIVETVGSDTLTWDGNTEGLVSAHGYDTDYFYKVSDALPTLEAFELGGRVNYSDGDHELITAEDIESYDNALEIHNCYIVYEDGATAMQGELNIQFPEKGIYFLYGLDWSVSSITINGYTGFPKEQVKQEYLPDDTILYLSELEGELGGLYINNVFYGYKDYGFELIKSEDGATVSRVYHKLGDLVKLINPNTKIIVMDGQEYLIVGKQVDKEDDLICGVGFTIIVHSSSTPVRNYYFYRYED